MPVEDQAQEYVIRIAENGTKAVMELGKWGTSTLFRSLGLCAKTAKDKIEELRRSGGFAFLRDLQRDSGTLKVVEIEADESRNIVKQLKKSGVAFHIERDRETGKTYLHFAAKDADEVKHAVDKVVALLNQNAEEIERSTPLGIFEDTPTGPQYTIPNGQVPFNPDSPDNGTFDFETVEWDRDATIVSSNLTELGCPFKQEQISETTQRFTYPRECSNAVAEMLNDFNEYVPGLDWSRINMHPTQEHDTASRDMPAPEQAEEKPRHVKTKSETIKAIKQRARERVEGQKTSVPKKTHAKTR
ncbi:MULTISPECIES: PcfB family protein [Bifidobacterium]|uniref:Mobilization protein n=2 Tax=Bifidobacterium TaxID=1678 RepID=A0A261FUN8_9BIFI|nr:MULTISPECIES: PcfB family protein [Bifidobacterium]OZG62476.1 hypothetical protein BLEM_1022 [Bifidobacterium lemurum]OZG69012.1 hypothetical protein BEUL_0418 [Bifidobacterium eulemuris]QOL31459.1 PcfB family protein [Bifidobacterium eulemuris]QOL33818.1 PcfB family protein [Bifidobacterium lemurum]